MTPDEAQILRWLELRGGSASLTALSRQFGQSMGVAVASLRRHLCIRQDRQVIAITTPGEDALGKYEDTQKPEPFADQSAW